MKKKNPLSKFTDEQLYAELTRRQFDKETLETKTTNINGFTMKDVVCMQGGAYDEAPDEYGPYYHFYLKVDNKLFDLYYMTCVTDNANGGLYECKPSRWPSEDNDEHTNFKFVPKNFADAMENAYEYHGKEDIKKYLKKCGITDYRVYNPELIDKKTGRDTNYDAN